MRKVTRILICAVLALTFIAMPLTALADEVPGLNTASVWARDDITRAFDYGIIPAALLGLYTQATTRAEFAALAVYLYETAERNKHIEYPS